MNGLLCLGVRNLKRAFFAHIKLLSPFFIFLTTGWCRVSAILACLIMLSGNGITQTPLQATDIYQLEYASDPRIAPDGQRIVFVRHFKDIMTDRNLSNLWVVNTDGSNLEPLTSGFQADYSPRWSPDGKTLLYVSNKNGRPQLFLRWMSSGAETQVTNLQSSPRSAEWSPNGKFITFISSVEGKPSEPFARMPAKPNGADWADAPLVIDRFQYRSDGSGYLKNQQQHLFLLSASGGMPRQLTEGDFNVSGNYAWMPASDAIIYSANKRVDKEREASDTELYRLPVTGNPQKPETLPLTNNYGPDGNPVVSPDGSKLAYISYKDEWKSYQFGQIVVMDLSSGKTTTPLSKLDREVDGLHWIDDKQLLIQYDDNGITRLAQVDTKTGASTPLVSDVGGLSIGRPYSGGQFHGIGKRIAYTRCDGQHPADIATFEVGKPVVRLTDLNEDLLAVRGLGKVEEIRYKSSYDQRDIQGWLVYPPNFDPSKKYPLLLEIHGGPHTNYGYRFAMEMQLFAAAGYVVLYTNPRGSTSYGYEFGNLIHHNYPNQDYDDLISGVDATIAKGFIDTNRLFVTGGSGGGVLTAWIVGKTDRFKAAVVAKPVINWYSFVLHADSPQFFYRYWFPGPPWEHQEHYMKRSPISLVGNVKTPTMLLTGEQDYRTPMSETEQYYAALKIRDVPTAMVRIQESGHGIADTPSNLIAKVTYILGWFKKYDVK